MVSSQDEALVTDLLHHVLGSSTRIAGYQELLRREDYVVLLATMQPPTPSVVVKLAGPHAPLAAPFDRTQAIIQRLREQTAVPTPEVLAADVSYQRWPWRYLITTRVPGQTLASLLPHLSPDERKVIHHQLGEAVAALHSLPFAAFGDIDERGAVPAGTTYPVALLARVQQRVPSLSHRDIFASVLEERQTVFQDVVQARLTHEDLNPTNILVRRDGQSWNLTAIIDFDSAWAGNPESDLARLDLWRGMASPAFWYAYEREGPPLPGYHERRPVLQMLWCLEYAAATQEHYEDTAAVCRELDIPPIDFCIPAL